MKQPKTWKELLEAGYVTELTEEQVMEAKRKLSPTKFTPGPWVIETYHGSLFKICKPDFQPGDEVAHRLTADAALISAAPEILEALESVSSHFKATGMSPEEQELNTLISAVLKKAKGE